MPPKAGNYFESPSPITGKTFCEGTVCTAEDIEVAFDAVHKAAPVWDETSLAERAVVLNRIEENREKFAVAETSNNGKAVCETLNSDIPFASDHFRYFADAIRAQDDALSQIDDDTVA